MYPFGFFWPLATAVNSLDQKVLPAMPSIVMPCTDSNARMAPTCKMFAEPGFHCDLSAHGQPLCQVNVPAGAR